ncbi:hypothetical protein F5Y06DRAFT_300256 [Hypoxylon sp. FL0890]|nr:hypothetical protein F5Y06DRAFT_300256 [Hypoxylon sp. FL0890]
MESVRQVFGIASTWPALTLGAFCTWAAAASWSQWSQPILQLSDLTLRSYCTPPLQRQLWVQHAMSTGCQYCTGNYKWLVRLVYQRTVISVDRLIDDAVLPNRSGSKGQLTEKPSIKGETHYGRIIMPRP